MKIDLVSKKNLKKPHPTISIGCSVFNEEKNIEAFISSMLSQELDGIILKEFIIVADGCTDQTISIIKRFRSPKIKLLVHNSRAGQQTRQNEIIKYYSGDILIISEADTLPVSNTTLADLVRPLIQNDNRPEITFGVYRKIEPKTLFERIMMQGWIIKRAIYNEWQNGNNVYIYGAHSIKAMSRNFTNKLTWPTDAPEDSYVYLFAKTHATKMRILPSVQLYVGNVQTMQDSIRQSSKFVGGIKSLKKYFPDTFIDYEYSIPLKLLLKQVVVQTLQNPFFTLAFICVFSVNRLFSSQTKGLNPKYRIYNSTKSLEVKIEYRHT